MKAKNHVNLWVTIICLLICSCSSDKHSPIVGTWTEPYNEWTNVLELSKDGSFDFYIYGNRNSGSGKYVYNEELSTLTLSYSTQQMTKTYIVLSLTENQLVLTDEYLNTHTFSRGVSGGTNKETTTPTQLERSLFNTSWRIDRCGYYRNNGELLYYTNEVIGDILTFSNKTYMQDNYIIDGNYFLYLNGLIVGYWYEWKKDGQESGMIWLREDGHTTTPFADGAHTPSLLNSKLTLRHDYNNTYSLLECSATSTPRLQD